MSYLTPRSAGPARSDLLLTLAEVAGITIEPEDLGQLAVALADQLASIEVLDEVDLDDFNPIVEFDPRWHGRPA
jgi:Asp-tRNA(Asn)/Glu-tRNA(Gln) amidotransferase C subunit